MTVDTRTPAEWCVRLTSRKGMSWQEHDALAELIDQVVVPLYVVWSETKPPCPTCDGKRFVLTPDTVGRAFFAVIDDGPGAGIDHVACPDCPESPGVQPFNNWVVNRLLATWNVVWSLDDVILNGVRTGSALLKELRQIGGTR